MQSMIPVVCRRCGKRFPADTMKVVDLASDATLRHRLLRRTLNYANCPFCGTGSAVDLAFAVLDPETSRAMMFVPEELDPAEAAEQHRRLMKVLMVRTVSTPFAGSPVTVSTWSDLLDLLTGRTQPPPRGFRHRRRTRGILWR